MPRLIPCLLFALAACDGNTVALIEEIPEGEVDADGDGFTVEDDCDDADADVNPDSTEGEVANGKDEDCSGVADDRTVCEGDVAYYDDLSEAVEDAPDGFVLLVCPGVYEENLEIDDEELTVRSTDGASATTIDGDGQGPAVRVTDAEFTLQGFTVRGGVGDLGGGVACSDSDLILLDNVVRENAAANGGGIGADGCDVEITGNTVSDNLSEGLGGGAVFANSEGTFDANEVTGNTALEGGGLAMTGGDMVASNNTISGNLATTTDEELRGAGSGGGGVWMDSGHELIGNTISGNTSAYNGGGIIGFQTTGDIDGNLISGNVSQEDGAGAYFNYSRSHVTNNTFEFNEAWDDAGGLRSYVGLLDIEGNHFEGNSAGDDGGGLKMSHSSNTVTDNVFLNNVAGDAGGGLELDNETAEVSGCHFEGNRAYRGAGVHSWTNEGRFTITDTVFLENTATDCGGAIQFDNNPYRVTMSNVEFTDNAANDGAAICVDYVLIDPGEETERYLLSDVRVENSFISDNDAGDDGGIAYVKAGDLELRNVSTHDNDSPSSGGFSVKGEGNLLVVNTIISGVDGATVILEEDGAATFRYSSFWNADGFYGMDNPVGSNGNGALDPDYLDPDGLDFRLGSNSQCVDAGDPSIDDTDGSRSDMGAYGGPGAP